MSDGIIRLRLISRLELNLLPSNIPPVRYDSAYYRLYDEDEFGGFLDESAASGAEVLLDGLRLFGQGDPVLPFIKAWERSLGHY